jgi:DNA polymerase-1
MEIRAAAHIFGDRAMTAIFEQERAGEEKVDFHRLTAAKMLGKDPASVTPDERKGAKVVNFGSVYGQGARGLITSAWEQFEVILDEATAKEWTAGFENGFPEFVRGRRDHYKLCDARQSIIIGKDAKLGIGRIFRKDQVPDGGSFYTRTCNLPVQGACADCAMLALAYVDARLFEEGIDGFPVAWLHDEIVLEVREDQADRASEILDQSMTDGFVETFPGAPTLGLIDVHVGKAWSEAKGQKQEDESDDDDEDMASIRVNQHSRRQ